MNVVYFFFEYLENKYIKLIESVMMRLLDEILLEERMSSFFIVRLEGEFITSSFNLM